MASILPTPATVPARRSLLDRVGATGSLLCAVHCAAVPLVLAVAPAIGAGFANHAFEVGFITFASLLGLTSLVLGYRLHRVRHALALLVPGIAVLWCGVLVKALHENLFAHAVAMAIGGTMIATAHVLNLRFSHAHETACSC